MGDPTHGEMVDRFDAYYGSAGSEAVRALEERTLGCSYGGNSFTDMDGALALATHLDLGPTSVLLDVGSGAGWPGLFLARESRCRVVITDLAYEGLNAARTRAE